MNAPRLVRKGTSPVFDVFGPTLEFLSPPTEEATYCVLRGVIPPGGFVPLHSHLDPESFLILSGTVQVLTERGDGLQWLDVAPGDFIEIPGGVKHAFRNTTGVPAVQLVATTSPLGRFFQEIGKLVTGISPPSRTPDDLEQLKQIAARYGYWLGSPEENSAVGIPLLG
jgi:quercetin dioxygenase-like cupin family protein